MALRRMGSGTGDSTGSEQSADDVAQDELSTDEGAISQPKGDGPLTLEDRTEAGGAGSPDTNQGKAEPMPATPDHPEPAALPELADMNVGAADPQAPSTPDAASVAPPGSYGVGAQSGEPTHLSGPGADADAQRSGVDPSTSTGRAPGPEIPEQQTTGTAHRATGIQGETPEGEALAVDTSAGARHMGPNPPDAVPGLSSGHGEAGGTPEPGSNAAPGTSETQPKVEGIRLPEDDRPA